ncbi:MAG: hypothetical protein IIB05_10445 [Bacteroidetes bacterium]|nr:hypothetical protein [Bacteroidota bacterium]
MRARKTFINYSPQILKKNETLTNFNESKMSAFTEESLNNNELFTITGGDGDDQDILLPDPPPPPHGTE